MTYAYTLKRTNVFLKEYAALPLDTEVITMIVLTYISVFFALVSAIGICGYLSESEKAEMALRRAKGFGALALNVALFALMFPAKMLFGAVSVISGRYLD